MHHILRMNPTRPVLRILLLSLGVAFLSAPLPAAEDPAAIQREAMRKLDWLAGDWQGTGWIQMGPEERHAFRQTETIRWMLDGLVLIIEGEGVAEETGQVVHSALAFVSYDPQVGVHRWRAFTADGRQTDTEAAIEEDRITWGFPLSPTQRVRFTIVRTGDDRWHEIGEMSPGGDHWFKFFEMTLARAEAGE
ncbi:MAG: DUF1579 domain-containing protein [Puniceicoccaceae bacterium]|nr:MAG: DUF1579 domain-containing protein [Puniceicoccaceae bacterium]